MQVKWKWCDRLSRDNLKLKLYTACNLWDEAPLPPYNILYAFPRGLHPNVIFPWDYCYPKTLDVHIFLKSSFFLKVKGQYLITLENIFSVVYSKLQSNLIWFLLLMDLWSGVEFSIWPPPLLLIITHAN